MKNKKKIKNIIFDVGNVLFTYKPEYIISSLLPKTPHKDLYLTYLFNSDYWQQLDRGSLSLDHLITLLTENHSLSPSQQDNITQLVTYFPDHLILNKDMKDIFLSTCKTHNVFILSNFQTKPYQRLQTNHPFLKQALGTVISATVMMKKPEIGIYHFLLSQYRLLPHECIFIDDMKDNIKTAKKLLIKTIHFKSSTQTIKELENHNITI